MNIFNLEFIIQSKISNRLTSIFNFLSFIFNFILYPPKNFTKKFPIYNKNNIYFIFQFINILNKDNQQSPDVQN
jgi:hypothetical protein